MYKFIQSIIHEIENEIRGNTTSLVRVEGIESPIVYKKICEYFNDKFQGTGLFKAKLSKEKYEQFQSDNRPEYKKALEELKKNEYVDLDGAMTKWRNEAANMKTDIRALILLMGTEAVQDTGGLADFYRIAPDIIINKLTKDYSQWFVDVYANSNLRLDKIKAIHTIFRCIFNNVNIDIIKLSDLVDELTNMDIYSEEELISEVFFRLNKDWSIPSIISRKKIPSVNKLMNGTLKSCEIITKAYNFITRESYKGILTKSQIAAIEKKIEKFAIDNAISNGSAFPEEHAIFATYQEFKDKLIDFINGKDLDKNRELFLNMDFAIIDEILNLKVNEPKPVKESIVKLTDAPLETFALIILDVYNSFRNKFGRNPSKIEIKVDELKLSNCINDEELINSYVNMCSFLGGILNFIKQEQLMYEPGQEIEVVYWNKLDPFDIKNIQHPEIKRVLGSTKNLNDLSKVLFVVSASDANEAEYSKYRWFFTAQNNWQNAFSLLNNYVRDNNNIMFPVIPMFSKAESIHDYINCESDEEFYRKLEKVKITFEDKAISDIIKKVFSQELYFEYENIVLKFSELVEEVFANGFYNTFCTFNGTLYKLIDEYRRFINKVVTNYDDFSSIQKDNMYLFLNTFLILKNNGEGVKSAEISSAIVPPYHPIILEKCVAQMIYIRNGIAEIFKYINENEGLTSKQIRARLLKYSQLSTVTGAFDVLLAENKQYLLCNNTHGYYCVYSNEVNKHNMLSDSMFDNQIIDDEEIEGNEMLQETPQSKIIFRSIIDYLRTFPSKTDGINILIVNPIDMQHIVAGIHAVVTFLKKFEIKASIQLRIIVSDDRKNGAGYLRYWLDNYFSDDDSVKIQTYLTCINLISPNLATNLNEVIKEEDICFIYGVLSQRSINFDIASSSIFRNNGSKFPMTLLPEPVSRTQNKRRINISQFQFETSKTHTQLAHIIRHPNDIKGDYRVLKELGISESSAVIIDIVHDKCKWVVCMDEAIDRSILTSNSRKVIGFTTGEGGFGELNVTVSAREDILTDIETRLKNRIIERFKSWPVDLVESAAKFCIQLTKDFDGSRILKALNPHDFEIHNFLAYVLTLQVLNLTKQDDCHIIRSLISLDTHSHWFDAELKNVELNNDNRPDFLLLEIENNSDNLNENEKLKIKATVIECKMGRNNLDYIDKAQKQLEVGIKVLSDNWSNRHSSLTSRYWFNQLYRALIFSKLNIDDNSPNYKIINNKILQILDGKFEIEWNGKILAFWLDENNDDFSCHPINHNLDEMQIKLNKIECCIAGQLFIQKMLVPQNKRLTNFVYDEIIETEDDEEFEKTVVAGAGDGLDNIANLFATPPDIEIIKSEHKEVTQLSSIIEKAVVEQKQDGSSEQESQELEGQTVSNEVMAKEKQNIENQTVVTTGVGTNNDDCCGKEKSTTKDLSEIRVLIGEDLRTKEKIYWEFGNKQLNNRHLLISGNSGTGKTYCIQSLLYELAMQGVSSVIFDYTDGFKQSKLDSIFVDALKDKINQRYVKTKKFPINPFQKQMIEMGDEFAEEDDIDVANRMAAVFTAVYDFGPQQNNVIYEAVKRGFKNHSNNMNFNYMAEELEGMKSATVDSVISKIRPFLDINPFNTDENFSWKDIIDAKGMVYIIQLTGFDRQIQIMLTEIILWDIWNYCVKNGDEKIPLPIVLDEAQNLNHGLNSPTGKILTEGRKFGLSGWFATQFMRGQLKDDEMQRLQQAGQKLYFSPPEKEITDISKNIDINAQSAKEWAEKLAKLKKGECVTCGNMVRKDLLAKYEPRIIKITSMEERANEYK